MEKHRRLTNNFITNGNKIVVDLQIVLGETLLGRSYHYDLRQHIYKIIVTMITLV